MTEKLSYIRYYLVKVKRKIVNQNREINAWPKNKNKNQPNQMPHEEQEVLNIPEHMSSTPVLLRFALLDLYFSM